MAGGRSGGTDIGLLILRLALGGTMMAHGIQKIIGGLSGFRDFVASVGIPKPELLAPVAVGAEVVGGLLVLIGVLAQLGALAIACNMVFAIFYVHWKNGFFNPFEVAQPGKVPYGYEYNVSLLAMALCILLAGPGKFRLFGKKGPKAGPP